MPASNDPLRIGGRYEVVREAGRGSSAIVYVAKDAESDGLVAIKLLREELTESRFAERFRREIRLMAEFEQDNILPIIESGEWERRLYYVMRYVEPSESLRDRLRAHPAGLPVAQVLEIARGVCGALSYAHARKVLHRDVKPENILLSGRHAYLTDFGVAKALEPMPDDSNTSTGYILGTQRYMSPEQELGDPFIDGRTDVWSICCVIFEMLAGMHPFNSPSASRSRAMKISDSPESLRRYRPNTPLWLERIVETGLKPNPADRWQSIDELVFALDRGGSETSVDETRSEGAPRTELQRDGANVAVQTSETTSRASVDAPSTGKVRRGARTWLMIATTLATVVAAASWKTFAAPKPGGAIGTASHVLAVNIASSANDTLIQRFAERLNEAVVTELAHIPAFRVVSTVAMQPCRDRHVAQCTATLEKQNVQSRLEGSVERNGDSISVLAGLVDERTQTAIPGVTVTVKLVMDGPSITRLGTRLATIYRQRLGAYAGRTSTMIPNPTNASSAQLRLIARERADAESLSALPGPAEQRSAFGALARVDSAFAVLVDLNPKVPAVWVERGWNALAMSRSDIEEQSAMLTLAQAYADSAFAREPNSPSAFELRGHVRQAKADAMTDGAAESIQMECLAEADLRSAVKGDENLYRSWSTLSWVLWSAGRTNEAKFAVNHAMESDAYFDGARAGMLNIFFAQLLLENFDAARQVCLSGHDLWPSDYKFVECQLTLMLYDRSALQDARLARQLASDANRLDSPEKARLVGSEYRSIYRDVVAGIVAARAGEIEMARSTLRRARATVAASRSKSLQYDFSPQEATLVWELGDTAAARGILVEWLKNRPDEVPNFRRDPTFRLMRVRDAVLKQAGLPLTNAAPACR